MEQSTDAGGAPEKRPLAERAEAVALGVGGVLCLFYNFCDMMQQGSDHLAGMACTSVYAAMAGTRLLCRWTGTRKWYDLLVGALCAALALTGLVLFGLRLGGQF